MHHLLYKPHAAYGSQGEEVREKYGAGRMKLDF